MKRLLIAAALLTACVQYVPRTSDTKDVRLEGIVFKNDTAQMILQLAPPQGDMKDVPLIRYNSLTILDRSKQSDDMRNLAAGEEVIVFGRQEGDGDILAERVVVK
ncbi:MAG TPA: hypothetical protein VKB93_12530 [Thermoanaerobaculia bacterium]|nr:hypothetical protein [Thermoanaerobaculia bacterium]